MLLGRTMNPRALRLSLIVVVLLLFAIFTWIRAGALPPTNFKDWATAKANGAFTFEPIYDEGEKKPAKNERVQTYFSPSNEPVPDGEKLKDFPKAPPNWTATTAKSNGTIPHETVQSTTSATPSYAPDFPYKLWQTAPDTMSEETWEYVHTWFTHNPSLRHEILSDRAAEAFVTAKYTHHPDIVELFTQLTIQIAKFDMLRYLVLLAEGGIYADIDVSCDGAIADWIPPEYYGKASLLIGQEFDYQWRGEGRELASQFTNWALMAKPGCKHLQLLVDEIVTFFQDLKRAQNCSYADLTVDMLGEMGDANIIDTTGPKHMSYAILRSLAQDLGTTMDDRNISDVETPRLIGDVLILPNVAFAAAQAGFRKDRGPVRVTHHYMGSWKRPEEKGEE